MTPISMADNDNQGGRIGKTKIFNDAIYGQIEMPALCVAIIDTPEFQRLRYIKQVGMTSYVYPGGNHTRFEHCLGVSHLAGMFVKTLREKQPELGINKRDVLCAQLAGLCHDLGNATQCRMDFEWAVVDRNLPLEALLVLSIGVVTFEKGHGPFSHTWQRFLEMKNIKNRTSEVNSKWRHEQMSVDLLDYICRKHGLDNCLYDHLGSEFRKYVEIIKQQINGTYGTRQMHKWQVGDDEDKSYLYEIVANEANNIDVDKWDYLSRDCHHIGFTHYFDYARLVSLARVLDCSDGHKHICFSKKATLNIQDMFHDRWKLHRMAYQHKVVKVLDCMILEVFCLADSSIRIKGETGDLCLSEAAGDMVAFTQLDDSILHRIRNAHYYKGLTEVSDDLRGALNILARIENWKLYGIVHDYIAVDAAIHRKVRDNLADVRKDIYGKMIWMGLEGIEFEHNVVLDEEDIFIEVCRFDYGSQEENPGSPLDKVWFYDKCGSNRGERVRAEEVSKMFPKEYEELLLLCFCRNKEFTVVMREAFDEWLEQEMNSSPPHGHPVTDE